MIEGVSQKSSSFSLLQTHSVIPQNAFGIPQFQLTLSDAKTEVETLVARFKDGKAR